MSSDKDPRTARLPGELEELYGEQVKMLAARCDAYYDEQFYEAKSAAAIIHTLLYDYGKSSQSLLGQLGLKKTTKFLDSRAPNLILHSAKGAWPRTVMPRRQHRKENLFSFDEWWEHQPFNLYYKDIVVTRRELIEAIRNKEGGGHVSSDTLKKIAAVRRSRSGWHRSITENEDGTSTIFVGISLTKQPAPQDSNTKEISDYELASVCAIAEEVLFSITPEPENRKRMHHADLQKPFYISPSEVDAEKQRIREFISKLDALAELEVHQRQGVQNLKKNLEETLDVDPFTSDDLSQPEKAMALLKQFFNITFE